MKRLRLLISVALAGVAFLNLWQLNHSLEWAKPRQTDDVVVWEQRLRFIQDTLMKRGYWRGDVGYTPAGVLRGHPRTIDDDQQWVLVRYVMIPWNIRPYSMDPEYVLVDGTRGNRGDAIETPAGFVKVYDSMDGLVLLKKGSTP